MFRALESFKLKSVLLVCALLLIFIEKFTLTMLGI